MPCIDPDVARQVEELKKRTHTVELFGKTLYVVEGDLLLSEGALADYIPHAASADLPNVKGGPGGKGLVTMLDQGKIVRWPPGFVLTYCVLKSTFDSDQEYEIVRGNLLQAARDWEATCGVSFSYVSELDGATARPAEVVFAARKVDARGRFLTASFFPTDPPERRQILIDPSYFSPNPVFNLIGVLRHALGHVLGFRHEHIENLAPPPCPKENLRGTIDLTQYDAKSVMHYFCDGVGSRALAITSVDIEGSQKVYGPPLSSFQFVTSAPEPAPFVDELHRAFGFQAAASVRPLGSDLEILAAPPEQDPAEIPPLDQEGIETISELFLQDPERLVAEFRKLWDRSITERELRDAIARARATLAHPARGIEAFRAASALELATSPLPPEFEFDGMDLVNYPIDPGNTQFETVADAVRWVTMGGAFVLSSSVAKLAPFRRHDDPKYRSRFVYTLPEPTATSPLDIALFADFGTGLYHSRYIAKQLKEKAFPYAIHLGDVYYAGRESEFVKYFKRPLDPILSATKLFTLGGNHERYSRNIPFFNYIDERRQRAPAVQEQEGSYFCLRSGRFQIVAIDTEYFGSFRYRDLELLGWAEAMLDEGRRNGRVNILLSSDEPYEYGSKGTTHLFRDLKRIVVDRRLVDLWFWGNTHYCALFGATAALPFIGSCIGHAGYPYDRERFGKSSPAPVLFLETKGRFPDWTGLRPDRGNNGYCVLRLKHDGSLNLCYIDWMSHERCLVTLDLPTPGGPLAVKSLAAF